MNIPVRYCTGYPADIGVPPVPDPMVFSAWFDSSDTARLAFKYQLHQVGQVTSQIEALDQVVARQ